MKKRLALISIVFSLFAFSAGAQENLPPPEMPKKPKINLFMDKETALYTNFSLMGGYCSESTGSTPQVKLKVDLAEGVFAKFSLASSASVSYKNFPDEGIKKLSLSIPTFSIGYYIWNFNIYAGGGFYQCWYFREEESKYSYITLSTLETVHSYGYEINLGLDYSITDFLSVFFEYSLTPHRWILKADRDEPDWIYPNEFNLGITLSIPWKI